MLAVGLHRGIPMHQYLGIEAMGSTHLDALAVSPLHYQYLMSQGSPSTEATELGSAVHMAVLEPDLYSQQFVVEPNPHLVAPDNVKPRATKAYREACAELEATGKTVLRMEQANQIADMADAVRRNPHVAKLLARAREREVTMIWERETKLRCRGRADILGDGVIGDLKVTRSIRYFSPFTVTKLRYHAQQAHYLDGLRRLGRDIKHSFLIAVEPTQPYDVAVFALEESALEFGAMENEFLFNRLLECELSGRWPGQFEEVQKATVTDQYAADFADAGLEEGVA